MRRNTDFSGAFLFIMETNIEIWKDIPGYEGLYQCSNLGNVKSLKSGRYKNKQKILSNSPLKNGYTRNELFSNKIGITFRTHQIVAMTFLDFKPNRYKLIIDHINGVRNDNRLCNLQIVTVRENSTICYSRVRDKYTSKYPGVHYNKKRRKYQSAIQYNRVRIYLGLFDTEIEASNAYQSKLKEILAI